MYNPDDHLPQVVATVFICYHMTFFLLFFLRLSFSNISDAIDWSLKTLLKAGIYRDKNMANKLMYIPNDDIQNYPFYN